MNFRTRLLLGMGLIIAAFAAAIVYFGQKEVVIVSVANMRLPALTI